MPALDHFGCMLVIVHWKLDHARREHCNAATMSNANTPVHNQKYNIECECVDTSDEHLPRLFKYIVCTFSAAQTVSTLKHALDGKLKVQFKPDAYGVLDTIPSFL